jgi:protein TonB
MLESRAIEGDIHQICEEMPDFPGGMRECMYFLSKNIKYPEEAVKNKVEGRVIIQMVVKKDGSIANAKVVRSIDPLLDAEALRVVNLMPKWKPGKNQGEAVRVRYTMPVMFKLK